MKKGFLGLIVPPEDFELLCGDQDLGSYRFNTRVAEHRFCKICGIHPYSRPRSHPDSFDVNLRCLDDGIDGFEIDSFDGRHWEENVGTIRSNPLTILLATMATAAIFACDARFIEAGPSGECREVAAQCVLEKGPLGVCEQTRCLEGESGPCLICTPQH